MSFKFFIPLSSQAYVPINRTCRKKPTAKEDDCSKGEDPVMEIKLRKLLDKVVITF